MLAVTVLANDLRKLALNSDKPHADLEGIDVACATRFDGPVDPACQLVEIRPATCAACVDPGCLDYSVEGGSEWISFPLEYYQSRSESMGVLSAMWRAASLADRRRLVSEVGQVAAYPNIFSASPPGNQKERVSPAAIRRAMDGSVKTEERVLALGLGEKPLSSAMVAAMAPTSAFLAEVFLRYFARDES